MAIIGIQLDRTNPTFTKTTFCIYMPQFKNYFYDSSGTERTGEPSAIWDEFYEIANNKIFYSIYGTDWKLAMSYCIAHYIQLIAQQSQAPSGTSLGSIAGGGTTKGVLASASIGQFSKTYDLEKTMVGSEEALFWNQTSYGSALMALLKTKAIPSIMVVTSGPIPGAN